MNQESKTDPSPTKTSQGKPQTGSDTPLNGEVLSPPKRGRPAIDDKAAQLEAALSRLEKKGENQKFLVSFVVSIVFLYYVSITSPWYGFVLIFLLTITLITALAYHWNFPQVVKPLNDITNFVMRRFGSKASDPPKPDEID
jgi:hypothetical protein